MKIAAIQLDAAFADVAFNLSEAEAYISQAALEQAELILLPEFFTSAIGFSEQMLGVPALNRNVHNKLAEWSEKYQVILGGSYISFDGDNAYNLFELVFPDGESFTHKKDIPTQFENCYYSEGDEENILVTPAGNFGVALCWEMIRYDTLRRIAGKADIILAGSCWWDLPEDAPPEREALRQYNQRLALETPVNFAKLSGIPVIHANHCGKVTAGSFPARQPEGGGLTTSVRRPEGGGLTTPRSDKIQTRQLVGGTQIIDGEGQILERRVFSAGAGFVISDVLTDGCHRKGIDEIPSGYWIPELPESYLNAWETLNPLGKQYYNSTALPYYKKTGGNKHVRE